MNAREFYNAVVEMRKAQKNYFKTRNMPLTAREHLSESKRLEKIIDDEIKRVEAMDVSKRAPEIEF